MMEEMQPTSESQRDAIVAWLEQDDNFLRVTAFSAPSGRYSRRGMGDLREAERIENKALSDLAASVNVASPRSHWDSKHAKQMMKHYLMEFKSAAREASKPGFTLSKTDEVFGIKTMEDKLNSMCPHFVRLQMLHDPRIRASMRGNFSMEKKTVKGPVQTKIPRTSEQAKVMPREGTAYHSNQNGASSKPQERTEAPANEKQADENIGMDTMTRNGLSLGLESAKGGNSETKHQEDNKSSPKTGKKRAVSSTSKQQQKKKKDEEESASSEKIKRIEAQKAPPRTTRSSTSEKTPAHVTRRTPNRSKKSPGNARKPSRTIAQASKPVKQPTKTAAPEKVAAKKGTSVAGAPKPANKPRVSGQDYEAAAFAGSVLFADPSQSREVAADAPQTMVQSTAPSATQAPVTPQSVKQTSAPAQVVTQALTTPRVDAQISQVVAELPVQVVQSTPAQPWFQVPDALRSAIAQVVSQRQELLNYRQERQPDHSDSDCNDEEEDAEPNNLPKDQHRRKPSVASNGYHNGQEPPTTAKTPRSNRAKVVKPRKLSDQGPPAVSRTPSTSSGPSRPKPSLIVGHIPPLLDFPRTNNGDTNLERKRAFLDAKKLAFEQFKWMCENELQQQEMELLRREMETREAFAQKEIELQRMNIRVDMIQRMVLVGASIEDITEQLTLLY